MATALAQLMRPAHWAKNVFVLAPLVFAQMVHQPDALIRSLFACVAFCAASSTVYIFNDYIDRHEDRKHPVKKLRPLAAGTVPVGAAITLAGALTVTVIGIGLQLGPGFLLIAAVYLLVNLLYTQWLKHLVILDVMSVSVGFVLRVVAGGLAISVTVSAWLLLCTFFLALFLAFSKRRHELMLMASDASEQRRVLTHYSPAFLDQMINVVTASTVVCYALYAISPETVQRFNTRALIYTIPFVLFGIFRYLYLTYQLPDRLNPTEAVIRDAPSLLNMLLWGLVVLGTIYFA
ncbi:MAG: decaprenyl-phosphate phosphoribosyltransferase [Acidobacteriota bacterium]|nr:decaprenyl-phosphate phosphoribosyltransferase [Acidobacteriota bacterium]